MSLLDFIMVALLTIGVLSAGMAFAKQGKNMTSFFAAGGAVPWQTSGLSLFMSFFSAGTFVVWGSVAYLHGWVAIAYNGQWPWQDCSWARVLPPVGTEQARSPWPNT